MPAWYDNDLLWETVAPYLFNDERLGVAPAQVESLISLLGIAPRGALLDLGCGVGRHSIEFARRGYAVTGVDRTRAFLAEARRRAQAEGLATEFVEADMRVFRRPSAFDAAINCFTTFGYFENPDEDLKVAKNLFASLRTDGRVVIDVMGKEILARRFRERDWHRYPDGTIFLEERALRSGWDWLENRWTLIKGSERYEAVLSHRIYSGTELAGLLRSAGFAGVTLYGSFAATAYDQRAERLVAVATK